MGCLTADKNRQGLRAKTCRNALLRRAGLAVLGAICLETHAVTAQPAPPPADGQSGGGVVKQTAPAPEVIRFSRDHVIQLARELSGKPHQKPTASGGSDGAASYDDYRKIRFRPAQALWHQKPPGLEVHALPLGWLFGQPILLNIVEDGKVAPARFTAADFLDERPGASQLPPSTVVPLSGFRINGPLNGATIADEIIVFQGASYFRALAQGQVYGLSARGLAVATASPKGEEFPFFREFWIERPPVGAKEVVIHALLDSPSTTGAFSFTVRPGAETVVNVAASLFPRVEMREIGIAPLTSMYMLGPADSTRVADFRPQVHDSDGLAILNGRGERVWRALSNPRKLQVSAFVDTDPRGFGLMQRKRDFAAYQDLEARYERRPSAWVEFDQPVGSGSVMLVEIPTEEEIHDNIVAFWRPSEPLAAGREHALNYRLRWRNEAPTRLAGPWVAATRIGRALHQPDGTQQVVIDYRDREPFEGTELPAATVTASHGAIENVVVQRNPETGGLRVAFLLKPGNASLSDMRLVLGPWKDRMPETWIYRWTR